MQRRQPLSTVLLTAFIVLASCSGVHQALGTLQDLQKVQSGVAKALGYNGIRVNFVSSNTGHFLNVAVLNSSWKNLPAEQKHAKALEIARLAYKSYPSQSVLNTVSVTFAIHRTYLGFFNYDDSRDTLGFEVPQLTAESPAQGPTVAVH